jgi:hypothetical protein
VLERAQARDGVEQPVALTRDLPHVADMDVEAVAPARLRLGRGKRHADPGRAAAATVVQQVAFVSIAIY